MEINNISAKKFNFRTNTSPVEVVTENKPDTKSSTSLLFITSSLHKKATLNIRDVLELNILFLKEMCDCCSTKFVYAT
jgi:hypothetical protein